MTPAQTIATLTPHRQALLAFSRGKDAWGAWLAARDHLDLHPYHLYLIPDLEFEDAYLDYAKRVLGRRIIRLPHPGLNRMLNNLVFQPPERIDIIQAAALPDITYQDIIETAIDIAGIPADAYTADGVRAADSPMRRIHLTQTQGVNLAHRKFSPCWDWDKARLQAELTRAGIRLPVDYALFNRTFDGIDLRFLIKVRDAFPRDYQRILDWFPLADMEIYRYEQAQKH
jgi:hypothetical protein